jgi:phage-related protein
VQFRLRKLLTARREPHNGDIVAALIDGHESTMYRVDPDAIVIADIFSKKSRTTPQSEITRSNKRLREYDDA